MKLDPVSSRIQTNQLGKAKPKGGPEPRGPEDSLVRSSSYTRESGPVERFNRSKKQERRERNLQYQDAKFAAHAAGSTTFMGTIGTMSLKYPDGRWDLKALAAKTLQSAGFATEFPADVKAQVADIMAKTRPAEGVYVLPDDAKKPYVRDMRDKPFVSIDNGTLWTKMDSEELAKNPEANVSSRDIDQLQFTEDLPDGSKKVFVAVSDLDAFVKKDSPIDRFMDVNTSSIYTPDKVFNLVPNELAEDLVSLNPREERLANVVEYTVSPEGNVKEFDIYPALVKSRVKLDYSSTAAFLNGETEASPAMRMAGPEVIADIKRQAEASASLEKSADRRGMVEVDRSEARIITENGNAVDVEFSKKNVATETVENFMINSNSLVSQYLRSKNLPTLERALPVPDDKNWNKIRNLAQQNGFSLPSKPDSGALSRYLNDVREADPEKADENIIAAMRLVGRAEYVAVWPGDELPGHFMLGLDNYMQSTASIRRGGDRVTSRLLKAAWENQESPYTRAELQTFADNLNAKGRELGKAERQVEKQVVATMLEKRVGETFDAVVTGVKGKKAWCRIGNPPIEGSLKTRGNVEIGDKLNVKLTSTDVEKGWIDFEQLSNH